MIKLLNENMNKAVRKQINNELELMKKVIYALVIKRDRRNKEKENNNGYKGLGKGY